MPRTSIGTRYAAYVAALALALVLVALVAAGVIALRQMRVIQDELHDAVAAGRAADEERHLRGAARYLGVHLFNALYQLDVERLNQEIEQSRLWLPVVSFLVLDRDGRVLTDGTSQNARYGDAVEGRLPLPGDELPVLDRRGNEVELRLRVAAGGVTAGFAVVRLQEPAWQASLRHLEETRTAELWRGYRTSLLSLGGLVLLATLGFGLLTSLLLSRTLARPLTEMSQAAAQIAAGNLDHPLTLDSPDELGDLARALNRLARDLRAHEEALRAERSDLAAKNAELERFNYTVSHDLKTPLVTIRGFAGLAGTDLAAGRVEAVRKDLGRIVAAADKMHRLLDDLLELSRIGRVVHPPENVPLAELVKDALEMVKGQLELKRVRVEVAPDLPVVRADRRRLL
jgi:signal transduction histidine kinase